MSAAKPDWTVLFAKALQDADGNKQVVADQLGFSRTTVSLVAAGKYSSNLDKFGARVVEVFDRFDCLHLESPITGADCKQYALRQAPTSSAREARHWRACQTCPKKPKEVDQ